MHILLGRTSAPGADGADGPMTAERACTDVDCCGTATWSMASKQTVICRRRCIQEPGQPQMRCKRGSDRVTRRHVRLEPLLPTYVSGNTEVLCALDVPLFAVAVCIGDGEQYGEQSINAGTGRPLPAPLSTLPNSIGKYASDSAFKPNCTAPLHREHLDAWYARRFRGP